VNESREIKNIVVSLVSGFPHAPGVSEGCLLMGSKGYTIDKIAGITITYKTNKELWAHIDGLRGRKRR